MNTRVNSCLILQHIRHATARAHLCTCLKHWSCAKKSMPCLIKKASRCVTDRTSKITFFIFCFLYNTKILRENHVHCYLIGSVVKIVLYIFIYIFFMQRMTDFNRLKRNMSDRTIAFLTSLLIALT